jgi:hypothetical protein
MASFSLSLFYKIYKHAELYGSWTAAVSLARTPCCLEPQGVRYAPSDARLCLLLGLKDRLEFESVQFFF